MHTSEGVAYLPADDAAGRSGQRSRTADGEVFVITEKRESDGR